METSTTDSLTLVQAFKSVLAQRNNTDINEIATRLTQLIIAYAIREGASDIHLDPKEDLVILRFRIDGLLKDQLSYPKAELPIVPCLRVTAGFPPKAAVAYTPEDGRFEAVIEGRAVQFRVSSFPTLYGDKIVIRVLDMGQNTLNLEQLGFSNDVLANIKNIMYMPSGLFIVAGMTGCGKSTTLSSILKTISRPEINIMTLEDPVEYSLPRVVHSQINPKAGFTFADGLRALLRQDPNVIMVGEIRDVETAEIAMRAAMTGHLILSTVHAPSTTGVIHRLRSMNIESYMISSSLAGVLAQRLVRRVCPLCAEPVQPNMAYIKNLIAQLDPEQEQRAMKILENGSGKILKAKGCAHCNMTGYKGRLGVFELLLITDEMRSHMADKNSDIVALKKMALGTGMQTLLMDGLNKMAMGLTTQEELSRTVALIN